MMLITLIQRILERQLLPTRIENYCKSLVKNEAVHTFSSREKLVVSCVQREIRCIKSIEEYIDMIYKTAATAVEQGSSLLVFPEYNFLDFLGLIPGFSIINSYYNRKSFSSKKDAGKSKHNSSSSQGQIPVLNSEFAKIAVPIERAINQIISFCAKYFNIYIYSGSYISYEKGRYYNAGSLYDPEGKQIGSQKKIHLTDLEEKLGIQRGNGMTVHELPFAKICTPICMDATYFETFRAAAQLGAEIVVIPIANMEEYSTWKALRGIWPRVQESYVFGLKASLNGKIMGMHFTGKAGIYEPMELTDKKDGIISIAPNWEGEYLISAELDIDELKRVRREAEYYGDSNPEFEKNFVEKTYFNGGV